MVYVYVLSVENQKLIFEQGAWIGKIYGFLSALVKIAAVSTANRHGKQK